MSERKERIDSKHKGLEERLKSCEEWLAIALFGIQDHAIIHIGLKGEVTEWNPGAEKLIGYSRDEALGLSASIIFTPEDLAKGEDKREFATALQTGRAEDNRWHLRKDGSLFYATGIMNLLKDEEDNPIGFVKVLRDSTLAKLSQEALERSEARYRLATQATRDVIWDWDLQTGEVLWNQALCTELGYPESDRKTTSQWWINHIHPDDQKRVHDSIQAQIATGTDSWEQEYRFLKSDGSYRIVIDRGYLEFGPSGKAIRMVGAMKDVTTDREAMERLRESEERFKSTFEGAAIGVAMVNQSLQIVNVNPTFSKITGYSKDELLQMSAQDLAPGHEDFEATIAPLLENKMSSLIKEMRYKRKDGTEVCVRNSFSVTHNRFGEITGIVSLGEDITEQKRVQEELKRQRQQLELAKEQAEVANASKTAFLANMSHEIRTPMTAVLGFTDVLRDSDLSEQEREDALTRIENSGRALLRLIEDILDISKIEAGKIDIRFIPFSPAAVVSEVVSLMRLTAENKGITLRLKIDPSLPGTATSDPARVRQILINMIGNAIKFTESGEVVVHIRAEQEKYLVFEVRDTGIGISAEDQEKLFQPFAQADESITRKFGGTGLGLVLSKRLAERMGGDLVLAESEKGRGSCFIAKIVADPFGHEDELSIPDYREQSRYESSITMKQLEGLEVLVAEDVADNRELVRRYLESAGAIVDFAEDGAVAIEKARVKQYALILMDIQMPVVDGFQALEALQKEGYRGPVLALTAHAMVEEVERSLKAGFVAHLTKPLSKASLIQAVFEHSRRPPK